MKRKCFYEKVNGKTPSCDNCHDACEDCNYFLTGEETKSIVVQIKGLTVFEDINSFLMSIESTYDVDIEFIEERID